MKNFVRINESRSTRPLWLSASAVTVAAAVAGAAGIAAGPGKAAPVRHATKASNAHKADRFKHPKLRHGVLTIEGTEASDKIALRLQAGDPGDTVEGQDGNDTLVFNGANVDERVALSANGNRLEFLRDPGRVTMDTAGVETVDFNALGGADVVTVGDLTGTDVKTVNTDLAGTLGGAAGDGQADSVTVDGTNGDDAISVSGDASGGAVAGLSARVAIQHQEPNDELDVTGLAGDDARDAAGL